jgi:mannose/fructose/N-acetylgalactosamine-specific phosphotransferase system component IID
MACYLGVLMNDWTELTASAAILGLFYFGAVCAALLLLERVASNSRRTLEAQEHANELLAKLLRVLTE